MLGFPSFCAGNCTSRANISLGVINGKPGRDWDLYADTVPLLKRSKRYWRYTELAHNGVIPHTHRYPKGHTQWYSTWLFLAYLHGLVFSYTSRGWKSSAPTAQKVRDMSYVLDSYTTFPLCCLASSALAGSQVDILYMTYNIIMARELNRVLVSLDIQNSSSHPRMSFHCNADDTQMLLQNRPNPLCSPVTSHHTSWRDKGRDEQQLPTAEL